MWITICSLIRKKSQLLQSYSNKTKNARWYLTLWRLWVDSVRGDRKDHLRMQCSQIGYFLKLFSNIYKGRNQKPFIHVLSKKKKKCLREKKIISAIIHSKQKYRCNLNFKISPFGFSTYEKENETGSIILYQNVFKMWPFIQPVFQ